jgi:hypothetical protein
MQTIVILLKKLFLGIAISALGLLALPLANTYALSPTVTVTPPPAQVSADRLQKTWSKEQAGYTKLGKLLTDAETRIPKLQDFISKAKAKGLDVTTLQAALDAFSSAIQQVQPMYQNIAPLISSHPGFDSSGTVVDATTAMQTVKTFAADVLPIHQTLDGPAKALKDAIAAFRKANTPTSTPTPGQPGG